jgi:glyoxylase-like metal-dependent hydrolase (beta-lactamase superfamily II)
MKIHHLNCGSMCPLGGHLFDGFTPGLGPAQLACHCLLIESEAGLVLVDTGFGLADMTAPRQRLSRFFRVMNNIRLDPNLTAIRQIEALGFAPRDVRHILLTHLDFDHAGGLSDFPGASVHVFRLEAAAARRSGGFIRNRRYSPPQWQGCGRWIEYGPQGEPWFGFETVRQLQGLPPEILMVPLVGHTEGHCGIAIDAGGSWLLHAGDAYFYRGEMDPEGPSCTPGLRFYQTMMQVNREARLMNQARLRSLAATARRGGEPIGIFCSHDAIEMERWREIPVEERATSATRLRAQG